MPAAPRMPMTAAPNIAGRAMRAPRAPAIRPARP
jgi:hypothetical protein